MGEGTELKKGIWSGCDDEGFDFGLEFACASGSGSENLVTNPSHQYPLSCLGFGKTNPRITLYIPPECYV